MRSRTPFKMLWALAMALVMTMGPGFSLAQDNNAPSPVAGNPPSSPPTSPSPPPPPPASNPPSPPSPPSTPPSPPPPPPTPNKPAPTPSPPPPAPSPSPPKPSSPVPAPPKSTSTSTTTTTNNNNNNSNNDNDNSTLPPNFVPNPTPDSNGGTSNGNSVSTMYQNGTFPFNAGGITMFVILVVSGSMVIAGYAMHRRNRRRRLLNERRLNELYNFGTPMTSSGSGLRSASSHSSGGGGGRKGSGGSSAVLNSPPRVTDNYHGHVPGSAGLSMPPSAVTTTAVAPKRFNHLNGYGAEYVNQPMPAGYSGAPQPDYEGYYEESSEYGTIPDRNRSAGQVATPVTQNDTDYYVRSNMSYPPSVTGGSSSGYRTPPQQTQFGQAQYGQPQQSGHWYGS